MSTYKDLKNKLLSLNNSVLSLIKDGEQIPGITERSFESWKQTCQGIEKQLGDDTVRVAVVGPIKSGKSTVVNSLFNGDYLKRGAGVVTSMVTRVRCGDRLRATLCFKPWESVNADINRAVVMLPSVNDLSDGEGVDIRDAETRKILSGVLYELPKEYLIARDTRNINSVLLSNYLAGYDRVRDIVTDQVETRHFEDDDFPRHREFVADDRLSVYLRDIQLEINSEEMDTSIEIADCQGSDSPNPMHIARIQDYLLVTNLIVYVISSRTGVRQADINFLSMIDQMGILENLIFVVNCDFNEHETLTGLRSLVDRIREEVSLIKPDPEVYVFSGLFNLFRAMDEDALTAKDAARLTQWRSDTDFVAFSDEGTRTFADSLRHKLNKRRYTLLLQNHSERLSIATAGVKQWAATNRRMLAEDEQSARAILEKTRRHREKLTQAGSLFKSTLDGASRKLKKDLKNDIDRFFDPRSGEVMPELIAFIRNCQIDLDKYIPGLTAAEFSNTLYMVFQEFKQSLDGFMTKTVNPRVMGFLKKQENKITEYFETIAGSYDVMAREAIVEYQKVMKELGISAGTDSQNPIKPRDIELIKQQEEISLPPAVFIMNYTGKIRTEVIMRLGVYSLGSFLRKVLRRQPDRDKAGEIRALKDGITRIKQETEKSILFHFKNYRENIKFQYVFRLVDAISGSFYKAVLGRFRTYSDDIEGIKNAIAGKQVDKEQMAEMLDTISRTASDLETEIRTLTSGIAFTDG
ncbi:MAG: dynamin family protein [Thermodesulfobacteriota bacterium]|nr:dynamin family protein [Thermodesulfobacteriota bacterium]